MLYEKIKPLINQSVTRKIKKNELIYTQGDSPESLFFVESGVLGLFHISETGKEVFLRVFNEGSLFGHRSYFAQTPYHANAIALSPSEITIIDKEECKRICETDPELLLNVTQSLAQDLGHAELRLSGVQDKTVPKRVCEALVFLKLKYPDQVWTRKQIADFSLTTFESVARVMTNLSERGIISKQGRDFTINDLNSLLNGNI